MRFFFILRPCECHHTPRSWLSCSMMNALQRGKKRPFSEDAGALHVYAHSKGQKLVQGGMKPPQETTPGYYCHLSEAAICINSFKNLWKVGKFSNCSNFLTRSISAVCASERQQISAYPKAYPMGFLLSVIRHSWCRTVCLFSNQNLSLLSQYLGN